MSIRHLPRPLALRALFGVLELGGLLVAFVLSLVLGVLVNLDVSPARRFAVRELNAVLAPRFKGTITVDRLGHLSIFGVSGVEATIRAQDGEPILFVHGAAARIRPLAVAKGALARDTTIRVDTIDIVSVEVSLDSAADGSLKIAGAFDPKVPSPEAPPGAPGTTIDLPVARVGHVAVHAAVQGVPPFDADLEDLRAAVLSSPALTRVDVGQLHLAARGLPLGVTAAGNVVGRLAMPAAPGSNARVSGSFDGAIGDIALTANVAMDGDKVDGVLDVPRVSAASVRSSFEGAPIYSDIGAHGEAHGDLSNLRVALHADVGHGSLDVDGTLEAKGPLGGHATIVAREIDARAFSKTAPATDVGARIVASAETTPDKHLTLHASIEVPVGVAAGQRVPATSLTAHAAIVPGAHGSAVSGHLEGVVDEPGAPLAIVADAHVENGVSTVVGGMRVDVPRLDKVLRLPNLGTGKATITIEGHATVAATIEISATVLASVDGFARPNVRVDHLNLVGSVEGSPTRPKVDAHVVATGLSASHYSFSQIETRVIGNLEKAHVTLLAKGASAPNVEVSGNVGLAGGVRSSDIWLRLERGPHALDASIASVRVGRGTYEISGLDVSGDAGSLRASATASPGALRVRAVSSGLDLGTIAYLAAQEDRKLAGTVSLDVDMDARRDHAEGDVAVDLCDLGWGTARGAAAHVRVGLRGRHLTGDVHTALAGAGTLDVHDMDVHIGGDGPLSREAWRDAWGKASVLADIDLARVLALAPPGLLHVADLAGHLRVEGYLGRDSLEDLTPEVRLSLVTRGLTASGEALAPVRRPGGPLLVGPPGWTLHGVDLGADILIDGEDSAGELAFRITDRHGALAALGVKTGPLPFATVLGIKRGKGLRAALEDLPLSVLVDVPRQYVERLPLLIRPGGVSGAAEGEVVMKGTLRNPKLDVSLRAHELVFAAAPRTPVDGGVELAYDGHAMHADVRLTSAKTKLLEGSADVLANVTDFLEGTGSPPAWTASAKADLARFPLGAIAALQADQVRGFASGNVSLTGLHDHAAARLSLALEDVTVGRAAITKGDVQATLDDKGLDVAARLVAPKGSLEAKARMGLVWGSEIVPVPDGSGLDASLEAKHFEAAAALPFAAGAISELSGWIDADAKISLAPGKKPTMRGSVAFSDGAFFAPASGEQFHGVKAKVTLSPDGSIKLEDTEAHGLSGRLTVTGGARLDGTTLLGADVALGIRKGEAIPLDLQGTNLGSVYGNITVKATGASGGKPMALLVNVPSFHVNLPDGSLPRSPQGFGDTPGVHVGVYRDPDRFLLLPTDDSPAKIVAARTLTPEPPPTQEGETTRGQHPALESAAANSEGPSLEVSIKIGDIQILRGQQLAIDVDGTLTATVAASTTVRGQVRVTSGKLNVQGKEFTIDKGTASFVGDDPGNPEVSVTAGWSAPDGTRILADYVGPAQTGKVTLRSEPPRPKNEIVSLLLFGTADGSSSTPYASKSPSTEAEAGTAVGGLATDGLSKGLDQLTGMNVTTKIDTTDSANPRPEVELQVAKDISLKLAVILGTPPPGENPDTTYATVDWRFIRNWSLETTFGDCGSTFADVVWQHRY